MEVVTLWVLRACIKEGLTALIAESSISLGNWTKALSSCLGVVLTFGLLDLRKLGDLQRNNSTV